MTIWIAVLLAMLASGLIFAKLGTRSSLSHDEAYYAQVAKEMLQTGDWLTHYWAYEPSLTKPPLYIWAVAMSFRAFGVSEFWARAPSAVSGVALVLLTYCLGSLGYGRPVGILAALILVVSGGFLAFARFGTLDTMLTCLMYVAVYGLLRLREGPRWWYLILSAASFAFLVKSVAVFVLAVPIGVGLLLDRRARSSVQSKHFWQAALLGLLIVMPWHVAMYYLHGQRFIDAYVGLEIVDRATSDRLGMMGDTSYYLRQLHAQFFPWLFLLPLAWAYGVKDTLRGASCARYLVSLSAVIPLLYTLSSSKLPQYLISIYPAAAILVAAMLVSWLAGPDASSSLGLAAVGLAALLTPRPAIPWWGPQYDPAVTVKSFADGLAGYPLVLALALLGALFAVAVIRLRAFKLSRPRWFALLVVVLLFAVDASTLGPIFWRGDERMASLARRAASTGPGDRGPIIIFWREKGSVADAPGALFYSDRPVVVSGDAESISALVAGAPGLRLIIERDSIPQLSACCAMNVLAEAEDYVYGTITPRGP